MKISIPDNIIDEIRDRTDIVAVISDHVVLKKTGKNFKGLCPFHSEKTPSFSINQQRQIYKCFGCGAGGGTINFIMEIEHLEFIEAMQYLADRYNIELNIDQSNHKTQDIRTQLIDLHEKTAKIYFENLKYTCLVFKRFPHLFRITPTEWQ